MRQKRIPRQFVATAGFTTDVHHQATSKIDDKKLSLVHFIMQICMCTITRTSSGVGREGGFCQNESLVNCDRNVLQKKGLFSLQ